MIATHHPLHVREQLILAGDLSVQSLYAGDFLTIQRPVIQPCLSESDAFTLAFTRLAQINLAEPSSAQWQNFENSRKNTIFPVHPIHACVKYI